GYASLLCKAIRERTHEKVMIRLFTSQSGVDETVAQRLRREIEELKKLPARGFVQHYAIRHSQDKLWYRISEWVDALNWGEIFRSGHLKNFSVAFDLFNKIASTLQVLHENGHIIPHLILDDIMVIETEEGELDVKIDYKLSRFFDPKLDRPGPMLKNLLSCHPDIINQRPLDLRSDIWSLGKIFLEILTTDFELCDHREKVDELVLPEKAKILFKTMLSDDPALRPKSMKDVADGLLSVEEKYVEEPPAAPDTTISKLRNRQSWLIAVVILLIVGLGSAFFFVSHREKDDPTLLEEYANQYAPSIGFILVDYWLKEGNAYVYRNRAEGTAFLVDTDGYFLTNRHVACPWLGDPNLHGIIGQFKLTGRTAEFGYRLFLWFEGTKAFNQSAGLMDSPDLADAYFLNTAYRSDGTPRVTIAGVAKASEQMRQLVVSPLMDDFAVIKIDKVPKGLVPLPLDAEMNTRKIPKLSAVIALGFPLGSRTQQAEINVSVTRGSVRRTFENMIQIDASIYGGNSGGPLIDLRGKVIGIVSGVATDRAQGIIPIVTPLWSMGMVYPITKPAEFLKDLKDGMRKWNGILDLSVDDKLKKIVDSAIQGRWAKAMEEADKALQSSFDPQLVMAAAVMHFCAGDNEGAKNLFNQSLSMEPENSNARLMLFIIDWLDDQPDGSSHREALLKLDWRSPAEFQGYLAKVLDGSEDGDSAVNGFESELEKSWLHYILGLIQAKGDNLERSETLLKEALKTAHPESWEFFLARSKLEEIQKKRLSSFQSEAKYKKFQTMIDEFNKTLEAGQKKKKDTADQYTALMTRLTQTPARESKLKLLEEMITLKPDNRGPLVDIVFYSAIEEQWEKSLKYAESYLSITGRQNARRLSTGLIVCEILHRMGKKEEAHNKLETYVRETRDPWYKSVGEELLGKQTLDNLKKQAGDNPVDLLILNTALGFWTEGEIEGGNKEEKKEKAIEFYRQALETFMDKWLEFDFAKGRIQKLRESTG
ncbi:MAG TPA: trypsin-like serine protease, partial [Deltaproteobacteria bacterium]|nr:trypsin-like serine protease [Deltaproteobacteria bacterium]